MKTLEKYLKHRETAIISLLEHPRSKYTPGTIHKIRLEIKKLNALFNLINYCSNDFKLKKTFKPFNKIFQLAGKIRELQLEESMLENFFANNEPNNYKTSLKLLKLKEDVYFFLITDQKFVDLLRRKLGLTSLFLPFVNKNKAKTYLKEQQDLTNQFLSQKTILPQQIHELRKQLKTLKYNGKSLSFKKKYFSKKDVFTELLGNWHDLQVISKRLNKMKEIEDTSLEDKILFEKIIAEITSKSEILFEEINLVISKS